MVKSKYLTLAVSMLLVSNVFGFSLFGAKKLVMPTENGLANRNATSIMQHAKDLAKYSKKNLSVEARDELNKHVVLVRNRLENLKKENVVSNESNSKDDYKKRSSNVDIAVTERHLASIDVSAKQAVKKQKTKQTAVVNKPVISHENITVEAQKKIVYDLQKKFSPIETKLQSNSTVLNDKNSTPALKKSAKKVVKNLKPEKDRLEKELSDAKKVLDQISSRQLLAE